MLVKISSLIEESEPGTTFSHLRQSSHSAYGQQYIIHVCYLPVTMQYRAYVFRDGSLVAWVLDPEFDHSVPPHSLAGERGIEKLIADAVLEIAEDNLGMYSNRAANV